MLLFGTLQPDFQTLGLAAALADVQGARGREGEPARAKHTMAIAFFVVVFDSACSCSQRPSPKDSGRQTKTISGHTSVPVQEIFLNFHISHCQSHCGCVASL